MLEKSVCHTDFVFLIGSSEGTLAAFLLVPIRGQLNCLLFIFEIIYSETLMVVNAYLQFMTTCFAVTGHAVRPRGTQALISLSFRKQHL